MSVDRFFHWTCNKCNKEVIRKEYGLPKKWVVLPRTFRRHEIIHYCEECKDANV